MVMNEQNDSIPVKWIAKGVHALPSDMQDGYIYTSDMPPVEADEFDRVFQLAQKLEAELDAVPVDAIKAIIDSVPVDNWTRKPLAAVKKWLATKAVQP